MSELKNICSSLKKPILFKISKETCVMNLHNSAFPMKCVCNMRHSEGN